MDERQFSQHEIDAAVTHLKLEHPETWRAVQELEKVSGLDEALIGALAACAREAVPTRSLRELTTLMMEVRTVAGAEAGVPEAIRAMARRRAEREAARQTNPPSD